MRGSTHVVCSKLRRLTVSRPSFKECVISGRNMPKMGNTRPKKCCLLSGLDPLIFKSLRLQTNRKELNNWFSGLSTDWRSAVKLQFL
jgi:hypothetical protein